MEKQELVEGTIKAIETFFAEDNWNYEYDEERKRFRTGTRLENKLKRTDVQIYVSEVGVTVYAGVPVNADKDCIADVNEFLSRANYGLLAGHFEVNYDNGDIAYKIFHDFTDGIPSKGVIEKIIYTPIMMVARFGNSLLAVMFGMQRPKEAYEAAEEAARQKN